MAEEIKATIITTNPTWGRTLELLQKFGHVFLLEDDSTKFIEILEATQLPYKVEKVIKGSLSLNKFVLDMPQEPQH